MSTTTGRHSPSFVIRLVGNRLRPWEVPTRRLATVLNAIQRLLDQADETEDHEGGEPATPKSTIQLLDVRSSSAAYPVSATEPDYALNLIQSIRVGIESPDTTDWSDASLSSLEDLSLVAKSLHCMIELRYPYSGRKLGDVLATIGPTSFQDVTGSAFVRGHTSVYARIERVGGAVERRCGIRLPDQSRKMVFCHVASNDLVRELGRHLYQHVVVSGNATWLRHRWRLKSLDINSFEPPKTGSIRDALRRIHDAGGHAWDAIKDPDAAIAEMRR